MNKTWSPRRVAKSNCGSVRGAQPKRGCGAEVRHVAQKQSWKRWLQGEGAPARELHRWSSGGKEKAQLWEMSLQPSRA